MARSTSKSASSGYLVHQEPRHTRQSSAHTSPRKEKKKQMKSNITNKAKPRHSRRKSAGGNGLGELEDEKGGVAGTLEDEDDKPIVTSLSDALPPVDEDATPRLTGMKPEDEEMFKDIAALDNFQAPTKIREELNESEDDYADVENISDSDVSDNEDEVLRSAEKDLIDEFERSEQRHNDNSMAIDMHDMAIDDDEAFAERLSLQTSTSQTDDFGLSVNMDEDPFFGLAKDDSLYNDMWDEAESAIWRMPETARSRESSDPNSVPKRVRFEEKEVADSSDSSSSEDPNDAFPDLFTATDDVTVKQHFGLGLEQDPEFYPGMDDADSFYDFEDEDEKFAFQVDEQSDSDYDSSTYDSDDEGDTTDEESREEQLARLAACKKKAGKTVDSAPSTPVMTKRAISTTTTPSNSRPTTPRSGKGPKFGTFAIDPTRAAMTTDSQGKKIKLLPPSQPSEKEKAFWERAKTANSSRTNTPPTTSYLTMPSPTAADDFPDRPFTAKSTLGSMFNGDLEILRNNDVCGIARDLFPAMQPNRQTSFTTTTTTTDDSDAEPQDINMHDFVALDNSDSESEDVGAAGLNTPTGADFFPTSSRRQSLTNNHLLDHFDAHHGLVGSFRRNQHTAKHFSSMALNPAKRASTHEFNALQKGKRGAANTPITPARRNRVSQDLSLSLNAAANGGVRKGISSPFSARRPRSRGNSLGGRELNTELLQTLARNPFD